MAEIMGKLFYLHLYYARQGGPLHSISGVSGRLELTPLIDRDESRERNSVEFLNQSILRATISQTPGRGTLQSLLDGLNGISKDMVGMAMAVLEGDRQAALELADRVLDAYHREKK